MIPDAMLFDLDGLLINTEEFSKRSFESASAEFKLGDRIDLFLSLIGTNEQHHNQRLDEELRDAVDPIAFRECWIEHYHQLLAKEPVGLMPGVSEILTYANEVGIKCAVATSSTTPAAEKKISEAGIREHFQTITCGDQVAISKPHPEIYEKAGASVDADMSRSVGLEDSANGVRAAHAAGLHVIQIPDLVVPSEELLQLGHRVYDSLHDVLELLKKDALLQQN